MLDFETKLRRYLCIVPAVIVCLLCGIAMDIFFDEEALHYHITNPIAVTALPFLILVICGGLTLLEWLYETAFLICESIRAMFGVLILICFEWAVFRESADFLTVSIIVGLPFFAVTILPLMLYKILMKRDKKRTIQNIQNDG